MYYLYFIRASTTPPLTKIGVSSRVQHRLSILQVGCPVELKLLFTWSVGDRDDAYATESLLHEEFRGRHRRGEWFELTEEEIDGLVPDSDDEQRFAIFEGKDSERTFHRRLERVLRIDPENFDNVRILYRRKKV